MRIVEINSKFIFVSIKLELLFPNAYFDNVQGPPTNPIKLLLFGNFSFVGRGPIRAPHLNRSLHGHLFTKHRRRPNMSRADFDLAGGPV